ncbi:DUF4249 family protein [Flectobacillus major]|uniref:DUF4249 family protein n=1 Tax=Flectobacillus major TaxID=103 RepID=UPI0004005CF4|nr:DUF4249 family protein [Flectobacillus major]
MKIFSYIILLLVGASLLSCSNEGSVEASDIPVVEAYLVAGKSISVHIKKEIPYSEESISTEQPIDGLVVTVAGGGNTYALKSIGNGDYLSDSTVKLQVGITYSLAFDYSGKHVSASTIIPSKPQSFVSDQSSIYLTQVDLSQGGFPSGGGGFGGESQIKLTWDNTTSDYYFVVVDNIETNPTPVIILPDDSNIPADNRRFRSQPVQGTQTQLNPNQFQYFGMHNIILMHVNADYAALYRSTGSTSQNISTPPTSIANGFGIFTGVNADTLSFEVKQR